MTDCCGGVNNLTGSNAESSASAGGITGSQIDLGSTVTTSDVDITYTVDDAVWVQGIDYDEAGRPFKLARTGLGDVVTASSTGQVAIPQISGTPSSTTFVKVVSGGTLSAANIPESTLQSAYDNSTAAGILTNPTNGAVNIRRGSAADTDTVLTVETNAGAGAFYVTGTGECGAGSFVSGAGAGKLVTTVSNNYHATTNDLGNITTGTGNVCFGASTGWELSEGLDNVLIGNNAGMNVTTGDNNVAIGEQAIDTVDTGSGNVCIGLTAGTTLSTADYNTCIGYQTDCSNANNQTAIGANATCDAANQVTIGDVSVTKIRPTGDGVASLGDATHQFDQVFVKNDITVSSGDINMTSGDVTVTAGNTSTNKLFVTDSDTEHPVTAKTENAIENGVTTSESSYYTPGDEEAWKAFDKTTSTRWASAAATYTATTGAYAGAVSTTTDQGTRNGEWVQYHDTTAFSITGYKLVESATNAYPTDWYVCGSTNGSTWIELDSQTGENINTEQTYTLSSESANYNYYRFIITASGNQSSLTWTRFQSMTLVRDDVVGITVSQAKTILGGELKMTSTTNAFIPPVLTTAQRDALTAEEGMVVYNTTTNVLNFYNGSAWGAV